MHAFLFKPKQTGASLVEFTIIAIPILILLLGSIETSQWYFTRQALSLALLEAGRSATTNNNHPQHIIDSFEKHLQPLFTGSNNKPSNNSHLRLHKALNKRIQDVNQAPWQIKVISPSGAAFIDFKDNRIKNSQFNGYTVINNDYLELQYKNGLGQTSKQDIFQANTLTLSLTWQHKPVLPLIKPILKILGNKNGDYKQKALYSGYLPMQREINLMMQTHPVQWPSDPSGKVIFDWDIKNSDCKQWLCGLSDAKPSDSLNKVYDGNSNHGNSGLNNYFDNNENSSGSANNNPQSSITDILTDAEYQELCGVTLCCIDWDE